MSGQFDSQVALVTGASLGIGRACALAFAREGAQVVIADVLVDAGEETVHLIKEAKGEAFFFKCDVSKSTDVEALVTTTVVIWLCSDAASFVTGHAMLVDGGYVAQ